MAEFEAPSSTSLLADAFAGQAAQWSKRLGAPAVAVQAVRVAARELARRCAEAETCASLDTIAALPDWPALRDSYDSPREQLMASQVVGCPSAPQSRPLVLDEAGRLYLHRYFDHERRLAHHLAALAGSPAAHLRKPGADRIDAILGTPSIPGIEPDRQRLAVEMALGQRLTLISGGPGTGKTTTVVALLGCLLDADPDARIVLAAPTGKAAARMIEAIRDRAQDLPGPIRERLPTEAQTLHRLLGISRSGGPPRHEPSRPLDLDVLIVDEASMLDLSLAAHLFDALPQAARVVMLGDRDQLAAVESGAVFADLSGGALPDCTVWLTRSHRFAKAPGIGRIAEAIRCGDADRMLAYLGEVDDPDVRWLEVSGADEGDHALARRAADAWQPFIDAIRSNPRDTAAISAAFSRFRLLCATREGRLGVEAMNRGISRIVRERLQTTDTLQDGEWFIGRPVLVLTNDYLLGLFNGDIGITLPDETGGLAVWFPLPAGDFRSVSPVRLPPHETAFAMTIHKSQGSEFDAVVVMLPPPPSRVLSRELLYTAVTRARSQVTVVADPASLRAAIDAPTRRMSGLRARLLETGYHAREATPGSPEPPDRDIPKAGQ